MSDTTISTGHTSTGITVATGDFLLVSGTVINTIVSGGTEEVQSAASTSGGTASFTMVSSGGTELVSVGGTASFTTVGNGGFQNVSSGGTAISATVNDGGTENVLSHGTTSFTTLNLGGFEYVSRGGTASATTVSTGGNQILSSGGTAIFTQVSNGGFQQVSSGTASFTTVSSGGFQILSAGGTAISTMVNNDGTEKVSTGGTASFTAVSGGGFEVVSTGGVAIDTTVSSGGMEVLLAFGTVSGTASGTTLNIGGAIDIAYLTSTGPQTASVDSGTDMLTISMGGGAVYSQQLSGSYDPTDSVTVLPGSIAFGGGTEVELTSTLCFCVNTRIETPAGEVKVQDLAVGDLVMTMHGIARPISWIGTGAVLATRGQRGAATPVIVRKGALADNVPTRDLRVTKGHSLYLDGALIPVEFLVNHRSIEWDDRAQEVKLFHIELETHDVLIANGAPAESYRDDGNRWLFRNANYGWMAPPKEPYAPVVTGGELVDAAWRRLLERAGPRPGLPLTEDADLHLLVDGQRLDAMSQRGETRVFRLAERPEAVRVVSRSGAPQELGMARDPRELGVALWRIMLRQGPRLRLLEAEDASLAEGFHGYEAEHQFRWTDGDALLPAALFDGLHGGFELELHVACSARYGADLEARAAAA